MPQSRRRRTRSRTDSGAQSGASDLLVFSLDSPLDYRERLGKIVVALAAKDRARVRGDDSVFLAGFDKLSSLRPPYQPGEAGGDEASDA
jgi:hypothetical protein